MILSYCYKFLPSWDWNKKHIYFFSCVTWRETPDIIICIKFDFSTFETQILFFPFMLVEYILWANIFLSFCIHNALIKMRWRTSLYIFITLFDKIEHHNMSIFITVIAFYGFLFRYWLGITNIAKYFIIVLRFITKTKIILSRHWYLVRRSLVS